MSQNYLNAIKNLTERIGQNLPAGHPAVSQIQAELERLTNAMRALHSLHATANPNDTAAKHFVKVQLAAEKLKAEFERTNDRIHKIVLDAERVNDAAIRQKVNHAPDERFGQELRAAIKAMTQPEKVNFLSALVEKNDGPTLFAITSAPEILTGLSPELAKRFNEQILRKHAPAEFAQIAGLAEARLTAVDAMSFARETAIEYSDPVRLAQIEKAEQAANDAQAGFEASIKEPQPIYKPYQE
jgi:peptidoglycan hydrolase-like protein with peptidoglycan-binding domain